MSKADQTHDVIVLGASAGGVEALIAVAGDLPEGLPAAVLVVLHLAPSGGSALAGILNRSGPLPAGTAADGEDVGRGRIYVAPPDAHLTVADGKIRLSHGPRENGHRPAVDSLFRSAAAAYGSRVVGVVLSGSLDDGSAGLEHVKRAGGVAIVQDPADAVYPSMPASAMQAVKVDRVLPLARIGACLGQLARGALDDTSQEEEMLDSDPAAPVLSEQSSGYTCPECGGALWEHGEGDVVRFRCRVGHAYSLESMLSEQGKALEAAMWAALQALQERESMLRRVAARMRAKGHERSAHNFEEHARDAAERATIVHDAILTRTAEAAGRPAEPDQGGAAAPAREA